MSSVDGACYLQTAPDAAITNLCDPCNYSGSQKEATSLCDDCQELFCGKCTESHMGQKLTRSHKILPIQDLTRQVTTRLDASCCVTCDCSHNLKVTTFCEKHNDVFCRNCKMMKHRRCKTSSVGEIGSSYTKAKLESLQKRVDVIKAKTDAFLKEKVVELQTLDTIKQTCRSDIKTFRKELNQLLDNLEDTILRELKELESQEGLEIEHLISSCSATTQMLETDLQLLDEVKTDSKKASMFAADVKISNRLEEYERFLHDISLKINLSSVSFRPNDHLRDLQTNIKELGNLSIKKNRQYLFSGLKVESSFKACIKSVDDTTVPNVSGSGIFPDGRIVLCDSTQSKLKLLNESFALEDTLTLLSQPYDVAIINDKKAVVTLPDKQQLQLINVSSTMKAGLVIPLDKKCYGVAVSGNEIYTSCFKTDLSFVFKYTGEVRVFDLDGKLQRKVGVNQDGHPHMFCFPYYVTVNDQSGKIFISDKYNQTLTCLEYDGSVVYTYKAQDMKNPRGVIVDREDNVLICDENSCSVFVVDKVGERKSTLLTSKDGIKKPRCVAYGAKDGTLIVGCREIKDLFIYKTV